MVMKLFYNLIYRYFKAPWDIGAREELVRLVESGRIKAATAIDLGCGTGANAVYLAEKGFQVTGVDYSNAVIEKAQQRAAKAQVDVTFLLDDLTQLKHVSGIYDFLLDYGVLDDLPVRSRQAYVDNILPLTHPGSQFLLWGFEYPLRWWEKLIPFYDAAFFEGEISALFSDFFDIEEILRQLDWSKWPPGIVAYLMTRKAE